MPNLRDNIESNSERWACGRSGSGNRGIVWVFIILDEDEEIEETLTIVTVGRIIYYASESKEKKLNCDALIPILGGVHH